MLRKKAAELPLQQAVTALWLGHYCPHLTRQSRSLKYCDMSQQCCNKKNVAQKKCCKKKMLQKRNVTKKKKKKTPLHTCMQYLLAYLRLRRPARFDARHVRRVWGVGGVLLPWGLLSGKGCASNQAFAPAHVLQMSNSECGSPILTSPPSLSSFKILLSDITEIIKHDM